MSYASLLPLSRYSDETTVAPTWPGSRPGGLIPCTLIPFLAQEKDILGVSLEMRVEGREMSRKEIAAGKCSNEHSSYTDGWKLDHHLQAMVKPALLVVKEHSEVYCVVKAASEVLTHAKDAGKQLGVADLEVKSFSIGHLLHTGQPPVLHRPVSSLISRHIFLDAKFNCSP